MKLLINTSFFLLFFLLLNYSDDLYAIKKRKKLQTKPRADTLFISNKTPPNHVHFSHWDSVEMEKVLNYERLRRWFFLNKNEVLTDSQVISYDETGLRTVDSTIDSKYNEYSAKARKLKTINASAYEYFYQKLKRRPWAYEVDSILKEFEKK